MDTKPKYSEDVTKAAQTKQELNLDVPQFRPLLSLLGWLLHHCFISARRDGKLISIYLSVV